MPRFKTLQSRLKTKQNRKKSLAGNKKTTPDRPGFRSVSAAAITFPIAIISNLHLEIKEPTNKMASIQISKKRKVSRNCAILSSDDSLVILTPLV